VKAAVRGSDAVRPRRILVTGGSRGIGRASVVECARRGADVILTYKSDRMMAEQAAREAEEFGVKVEIWQLDISDTESLRAFSEKIDNGPQIDAVVLNAGVWAGGRVGTIDDDTWWEVVETNLFGSYRITKLMLGMLRRSEVPSITMVSSVVGITGFPGDTAYSSAKGAMVSFAKSLAKEVVRDGIRVNVIAPGFVATDMTARLSEGVPDRVITEIPMARSGLPEEIAKGVAFLVFDGSYMTGTVLTMDGGWSL